MNECPTDYAIWLQYARDVCPNPDTVDVPVATGSLPFTGFEALSFVAIALILIAAGILLRRAGKKPL